MPSAMNGNGTAQTASPDVGSAPGAVGQILLGGQSEVLKQVLGVIEKKLRNMEKKKGKLDDYQDKKNKGEGLNQDQLEALTKFQEIAHNLEFARELQKNFHVLGLDIQKAQKKSVRREQLKREEGEQKRLKSVLELQYVLDRLGDDGVRQELRQGAGGSPLLSDPDLTALDDFYKLVGPDRDQNVRLSDQYEEASVHLWDLLEARDKAVVGTTYKALKESLEQVLQSGYFDKTPPRHHNGLCEEEEEEEDEEEDDDDDEEEEEELAAVAVKAEPVAVESSEAEDQTVDAEVEIIEDYTEPIEVEATEFVNRQFIPDGSFSSSDKDQGDEWTASDTEISIPSQAVGAMQPHLVQTTPPPPAPLETAHPLTSSPPAVAPADPLVRKQVVHDLMAQMQGTYNFMQDSMLEFDGHPVDPAIVSSQPMKPGQNVDLPQMVCPPVHPESRLSQPNAVSVQPEPTQVAIISTPPPMFQTSHTPDARAATEPVDPIQPSMSLGSEQPPPPTSLPPVASQTPPAFQTVSKAPPPAAATAAHSGGINVNAAPFQSMQTVFNLNAPVPPANETEALDPASQYQNSYSQGFNGQSQPLPVEQVDMPSEQLQSVGAFHSQDDAAAAAAAAAGHPGAAQQNAAFGGRPQSFYNSRGMSRGGPRNARGMINGYRGSANGFRGGYDYRPPFANTPNSGYGQTQFSAPRDYPNGNYQRDGYQQSNYKRGASQGPRGAPRGTGQAMRS